MNAHDERRLELERENAELRKKVDLVGNENMNLRDALSQASRMLERATGVPYLLGPCKRMSASER